MFRASSVSRTSSFADRSYGTRTNLARQRRMKDIEERNREKLFPPPAIPDITMEQTHHVNPDIKRNLVDDRKTLRDQLISSKHQQTPSDMKNILRRLHNLELIASSDITGPGPDSYIAGPQTGAQPQ